MMKPDHGHVVELELHGLELVVMEVEITICNFESLDGSLAVYGTGRTHLDVCVRVCALFGFCFRGEVPSCEV